jgi:Na+/H+ antiporter NhaD/arsenite permease-like protein
MLCERPVTPPNSAARKRLRPDKRVRLLATTALTGGQPPPIMPAVELNVALALAIFAFTYFVLAVGNFPGLKLDRTGAALVGALAMVLSGTLGKRAAFDAIDFPTLLLLFGMMIVVANLRLSGAFELAARWLLARARSGFGLLAMTVLISGLLAAFFINDVVCLALAPPLIELSRLLEMDAAPLLLALATASNIGSVATLTGNPQNMIVAGFAHLGYAAFAARLAPVAIVGLIVDYAVIAWLYRCPLRRIRRSAALTPPRPAQTRHWALIKSALVAVAVLAGFALGYSTWLVAMAGGAALLFTRRTPPESVYGLVDWTLLVMFAGLFVVVAGAETTGVQNDLLRMAGPGRLHQPGALAALVAILSNLVSNVPAVMLFRPIYAQLDHGGAAGLILASASTLAGNLTLLGSIANLIVVEQARREGITISFVDYLRVGLPVTLVTLVLDMVWLRLLG